MSQWRWIGPSILRVKAGQGRLTNYGPAGTIYLPSSITEKRECNFFAYLKFSALGKCYINLYSVAFLSPLLSVILAILSIFGWSPWIKQTLNIFICDLCYDYQCILYIYVNMFICLYVYVYGWHSSSQGFAIGGYFIATSINFISFCLVYLHIVCILKGF